jgi:hypothetical protein
MTLEERVSKLEKDVVKLESRLKWPSRSRSGGVSGIEYGLIAALIAVAAITAMQGL